MKKWKTKCDQDKVCDCMSIKCVKLLYMLDLGSLTCVQSHTRSIPNENILIWIQTLLSKILLESPKFDMFYGGGLPEFREMSDAIGILKNPSHRVNNFFIIQNYTKG